MNILPRLYLAGKISKNDWRSEYLTEGELSKQSDAPLNCQNFRYSGPFFINCDHGCYHGPNSHGLNSSHGCSSGAKHEIAREDIPVHCRRWIVRSDLLYAWIDDPTCFGTLVEIGWAQVIGKPIYLAFSNRDLANDMWFAARGARTWSGIHTSAKHGLAKAIELARTMR